MAIQRAARESMVAIRSAVAIAFSRRRSLRLPIWRSAQFTAFFTKVRSSVASGRMMGRNL